MSECRVNILHAVVRNAVLKKGTWQIIREKKTKIFLASLRQDFNNKSRSQTWKWLTTVSLIRNFVKQNTRGNVPKFPSVLHVIDISDQNSPIAATSVTF